MQFILINVHNVPNRFAKEFYIRIEKDIRINKIIVCDKKLIVSNLWKIGHV